LDATASNFTFGLQTDSTHGLRPTLVLATHVPRARARLSPPFDVSLVEKNEVCLYMHTVPNRHMGADLLGLPQHDFVGHASTNYKCGYVQQVSFAPERGSSGREHAMRPAGRSGTRRADKTSLSSRSVRTRVLETTYSLGERAAALEGGRNSRKAVCFLICTGCRPIPPSISRFWQGFCALSPPGTMSE